MKFSLFIVLSFCTSQFCCQKSLVTLAAGQAVHQFFANQSEGFDILVYGEKSHKMSEIVTEVMKVNVIPTKLIHLGKANESFTISRSLFLLFNKLKTYKKFHKNAKLGNKFLKSFQFLVYINENHEKASAQKALIKDEYYLVETESSVKLTTFLTFQQPNCREWNEVEVNRFLNASKK